MQYSINRAVQIAVLSGAGLLSAACQPQVPPQTAQSLANVPIAEVMFCGEIFKLKEALPDHMREPSSVGIPSAQTVVNSCELTPEPYSLEFLEPVRRNPTKFQRYINERARECEGEFELKYMGCNV